MQIRRVRQAEKLSSEHGSATMSVVERSSWRIGYPTGSFFEERKRDRFPFG